MSTCRPYCDTKKCRAKNYICDMHATQLDQLCMCPDFLVTDARGECFLPATNHTFSVQVTLASQSSIALASTYLPPTQRQQQQLPCNDTNVFDKFGFWNDFSSIDTETSARRARQSIILASVARLVAAGVSTVPHQRLLGIGTTNHTCDETRIGEIACKFVVALALKQDPEKLSTSVQSFASQHSERYFFPTEEIVLVQKLSFAASEELLPCMHCPNTTVCRIENNKVACVCNASCQYAIGQPRTLVVASDTLDSLELSAQNCAQRDDLCKKGDHCWVLHRGPKCAIDCDEGYYVKEGKCTARDTPYVNQSYWDRIVYVICGVALGVLATTGFWLWRNRGAAKQRRISISNT
jgi:hypothetical protein